MAVWWGPAHYDDELLDLRGPKVYSPLHHKLRWCVYYDTVRKYMYRFVLRRLRDRKMVYILGVKGKSGLDQ